MTMRRKRFPVMLSAEERRALQALAKEDGLSGAATVRRLIRQEARRLGLLPPADADAADQAQKLKQQA